jgi:hypothetical protein
MIDWKLYWKEDFKKNMHVNYLGKYGILFIPS